MNQRSEAKLLLKQEANALKNKVNGKSYNINDFSFRFKKSPAYQKEFKEIVVNYLYRDQVITYYVFVRKEFDNKQAIENAKRQINKLIETGEMREYAKYYYHNFY